MLDLSLDHNIIIYDEFTAAIQELDILFNTEPTELINNHLFGTSFEQFLWQITPAVDAVKQYVSEKLSETYFLSKMNYNINVNLYKGEIRMIYNIEIHIEDNKGNKITRKYQFR